MEIDGVDSLIRSPSRRTLALTVDPEGKVRVTAPSGMAFETIAGFVRSRSSWIEKHREAALRRRATIPVRRFVEGEEFLFKGQTYPLLFECEAIAPIRFNNAFIVDERYREKARLLLVGWYELKAEEFIAGRVEVYAAAFGLSYSRVRVVDTRRQWGSCTAEGNLSFCWRLVMCPTRVIDYVVAHELAHLEHMNHSKAFWQLVGRMRPDFMAQRQWLKEHAHLLTL